MKIWSEHDYKNNDLPSFRPLWPLAGGHSQTIGAWLWKQPENPKPNRIHKIKVNQNDSVVLVENCPDQWKPGDKIVLMSHGLSGCSASSYLRRMTLMLQTRNIKTFRLNQRGCGEGFGLSKTTYHSGRSHDLRTCLEWIQSEFPESPVILLGFSLSANQSIKMLGEAPDKVPGNLIQSICVSPPLDLYKATQLMNRSTNRLFQKYFIKHLVGDVHQLHQKFPELGPVTVNDTMSIQEFDDAYTAPRNGFKSAIDYYQSSSCQNFISEIQHPLLILASKDDPIVGCYYDFNLVTPSIQLALTERGGHVGYLGQGSEKRWMDYFLTEFIHRL